MGNVMVTSMIACVGMRVHRGRDWPAMYDNQDRQGKTSTGKIVAGAIQGLTGYDTCTVTWDNGYTDSYKIGSNGEYHLYVGEPEAIKPTVQFNGRNSFSTWNIEHNSHPLIEGDELMCVIDSSSMSVGHVVKVMTDRLNWADITGPTVDAKMHSGTKQGYYLKRYVPYGATAVRLGYTDYSGITPVLKVDPSILEVGDLVSCIDNTKEYVKYCGIKIGDIFTVTYSDGQSITVKEPTSVTYLERSCFALYQKKGTLTPSSNSQTINTNKNVTDTDTGSGKAIKVQRPSCFLAGASGYSANPIQGRRSKAKLG